MARDKKTIELINLGPRSVEWLAEAGINTRAQLAQAGAVHAYLMIRKRGHEPSLNLLYALEGALTDKRWDRLTAHDRARLLFELEESGSRLDEIRD